MSKMNFSSNEEDQLFRNLEDKINECEKLIIDPNTNDKNKVIYRNLLESFALYKLKKNLSKSLNEGYITKAEIMHLDVDDILKLNEKN